VSGNQTTVIEKDEYNLNKFMSTYTNGAGHVIVTCVTIISVTVALVVMAMPLVAYIGIMSPIVAFWCFTGAVNVATRTTKNTDERL